jgi:phage head maturation protease
MAETWAARAGGQTAHPADTERLHEYWVRGPGAAKIRWGDPGDFDRCVLHLGKFIRDPQGYCNLAHHAALGIYPATHAAEIKKATGRSAMADTSSPDSGRAESLAPFYRSFPLEDISIRSGGDGRTVEAYAAVFGVPSKPIHDQDGEYTEELDPAIFNRAISDAAPQGGRKNWRMGVFYNHGMTLYGTPSERHSMPIGVTLDMKADARGLWTLTRYNRSQVADEVLENIREGSIPGYSFSGNFRRSEPLIPRGGFRKNYRTGALPHVRRTESTLGEYGPTPRPIYDEAAVVGMRAEQLFGAMAADPDLAMRMFAMFRDGAPMDSPPPGAPRPGDSPAEDSHQPVLVRSGRSVKEEMQAARSAFLQRHRRN